LCISCIQFESVIAGSIAAAAQASYTAAHCYSLKILSKSSISLSLAGCNNKGSGGCRLFVRACLRRNARGEGAFLSARASDDVLRLCVPGSRAVKWYGGWARALPRVSCVGGAARPARARWQSIITSGN
jgi:hypothetical protein